jgi:hypothetical protein
MDQRNVRRSKNTTSTNTEICSRTAEVPRRLPVGPSVKELLLNFLRDAGDRLLTSHMSWSSWSIHQPSHARTHAAFAALKLLAALP